MSDLTNHVFSDETPFGRFSVNQSELQKTTSDDTTPHSPTKHPSIPTLDLGLCPPFHSVVEDHPRFYSAERITQNNTDTYQHDLFIYENILQQIRDMRVLSSAQLNHLNGMSRRKLLYIISTYNMVIRNVNDVL